MPTNGKLVRTTVTPDRKSDEDRARRRFWRDGVLSQSEGLRYIINKYAEMKATGVTG